MKTKQKQTMLFVGTADSCADIQYLCGFHAPDPVVLLVHGRRKLLVVCSMEAGRATREVLRATEVTTPEELGVSKARLRWLSEWAGAAVRQLGVRAVLVGRKCPVGIVRALEEKRIRVEVTTTALIPQRQVKTTQEIARITQSQRAAVAAMRAAQRLIRESRPDSHGMLRIGRSILTSERVRSLILRILLDHNCLGRGTIVGCGRRTADPHWEGTGPLRAGQPIVIDIFPQHMRHGYWGDLTRTVVRGAVSQELRRQYRAVYAAQRAALRAIRPGVVAGSVHNAAARELERCGYTTTRGKGAPSGFIHGTGHGVGLEIHEMPLIATTKTRLRRGNVITVEPGLYYPETGGIRIEDTVVVTETGWRYLAQCKKALEPC